MGWVESRRYSFAPAYNRNMVGRWSGLFTAVDEGVRVTFTEQVEAKRRWMKPFVPGYLKRQQALYIANLWRKLSE